MDMDMFIVVILFIIISIISVIFLIVFYLLVKTVAHRLTNFYRHHFKTPHTDDEQQELSEGSKPSEEK
jgi:biopolymer transport protein ExbB/TolQ